MSIQNGIVWREKVDEDLDIQLSFLGNPEKAMTGTIF
jgi:hypothetical protein